MDNIEIHAHFWYLDESKYVIDKISKKFSDRINISLIEGSESNSEILEYAQSKFKVVKYVLVENMGTDQNGFIKSYKTNCEEKDWIFYVHDKKDLEWIDDIIDPLINTLDNFNPSNMVGIIGSKHKQQTIEDEEYVIKRDKELPFESKLDIVRIKHTLVWLRQLQYIAFQEHGFFCKEKINFDFIAGTMFIAKREVVQLTHECVHDSFFTSGYSPNGKLEHGLERFYGYINECLKLEMETVL